MKEKKSLKGNSLNKFEGLYILLILILPFIYVKTIVDPVLIPRQILLSIFLLLTMLFLFFQKQKDGFQFSNKLIIAYCLLPILYCVSIFQSINILESYYTISKILLFSSFFILTTYLFVSGKIKFETILKALIVFSCFIVVSTILEVFKLRSTGVSVFKESNMYLITSTFGHKNLLSSAIFMCIPFLCAAFLSLNKSWKIAASINIFFAVLLIFMLQTRAVIAGMGLSFLITSFLSLFLFRGQKERKYIRMIGFGAIVVLLGFLFVAVKYSDKFSLLTKTESMRERVNIWHNTLEMIKEFPLTGVGAGNWQIHFPNYGLTRFYDVNFSISEGLTNFQRPHNDFLWVFSETGILGFIIYCSIFILSIFYLFKLIRHSSELNQKIIYLLFLFTILGYVFIALIDFPLERMEHQILLGLMLAFITSQYINTFENSLKKYDVKYFLILLAVTATFALWLGFNRFDGEKHSNKLLVAHQRGDWNKMISEGNKAINTFYNMDPFSIPIKWYIGVGQFTLGDIPSAKKSFEEAYQIHPYQVHVLNNYATCFEKEGNHNEAIKYFEEMFRISPKFSAGLVNLSGAYYNAGKFEEAYQTISKFNYDELNPQSQDFMKAILAKKMELMLQKNKYSVEERKRITDCMASDELILKTMKECQKQNMMFDEFVIKEVKK